MKIRHLGIAAITSIVLIYVSIVAWIYFNQRSLLYFPDKNINELSSYNLGTTQEIFLESADGTKIQTWYSLPSKEGMPMVIYYHGNAHHLGQRNLKFKELIDMGYGFIAVSYRGFGKSEGAPSEAGIYNDARAAVKFLNELGYETSNTIVIGESLGSGMAVKMATENKFKGIFLITPYTKIADRAQEIYWYLPVSALIQDNFNNIDNINKINGAPLLIVHGTEDDVIPDAHSQILMDAATGDKKLIIYPGKGHNNLDTRELYKEMTKYFNLSDESGVGVRHFA